MTTLSEISKKLNRDLQTEFPTDLMDTDIGNYTFDNVKQIDEDGFVYLYSNKNNPQVKMIFNEDRMAIVLYELQDDGKTVNTTTWRSGKKISKKFTKDELKNIF